MDAGACLGQPRAELQRFSNRRARVPPLRFLLQLPNLSEFLLVYARTIFDDPGVVPYRIEVRPKNAAQHPRAKRHQRRPRTGREEEDFLIVNQHELNTRDRSVLTIVAAGISVSVFGEAAL